MRCPYCGSEDTRVIDSRPADQGSSVRRRRMCVGCERRFTTYERLESVLMIRKRDGRAEAFDRLKVRRGLESALADRPASTGELDRILRAVEAAARRHGSEVGSELIGRTVLEELRRVDEVAYLRFASVYKDFQGASDFEREMATLEGED